MKEKQIVEEQEETVGSQSYKRKELIEVLTLFCLNFFFVVFRDID